MNIRKIHTYLGWVGCHHRFGHVNNDYRYLNYSDAVLSFTDPPAKPGVTYTITLLSARRFRSAQAENPISRNLTCQTQMPCGLLLKV